jgi:hypothetical protein
MVEAVVSRAAARARPGRTDRRGDLMAPLPSALTRMAAAPADRRQTGISTQYLLRKMVEIAQRRSHFAPQCNQGGHEEAQRDREQNAGAIFMLNVQKSAYKRKYDQQRRE